MTRSLARLLRFSLLWALAAALLGCGGGGGGGGGGSSNNSGASLTLGRLSVAFVAFAGDPATESVDVSISWSGSNVAGYVIGTLPGVPSLPSWLSVSNQGNTSPSTMTLRRNAIPQQLPTGQYSTTIRVVTGDANQNVIRQVDLPITLDVIPLPTIAPTNASMSWIESEQPAQQQFTVTLDSRVQIAAATVNASWLAATVAGNTITLAATADARTKPPGNLSATLHATLSLSGMQRALDVPITATVGRALSAPVQLSYEVNGSTTIAGLASVAASVTTSTQTPVSFTAATNVPWLTAAGGATGAPNNLGLQIQADELESMDNGQHTATVMLTATTPNISPLQIPVTLNLNLPQVTFVGPVSFTDRVATDYVVVRGAGLSDPNIDLRIAGGPAASVTVVNDTELHVVAGAGFATAGDYEVTVSNELGFDRRSAKLRVTEAPAYSSFEMDAVLGDTQRVISSPINGVVLAVCLTCGTSVNNNSQSLIRFEHHPGATPEWTMTEHFRGEIFDIALSPDETELVAAKFDQLLILDPRTLAIKETHMLPFAYPTDLAMTSDGLVIVDSIGRSFSLASRTFAPLPNGYQTEGGVGASLDGSRVVFGRFGPGYTQPLSYYDAATGAIAELKPLNDLAPGHYGAYDRHGNTLWLANELFVGRTVRTLPPDIFSLRGSLAPDGRTAYRIGFPLSGPAGAFLRIIDISGTAPFPETQIPLPAPPPSEYRGSVTVDPHGDFAFVLRLDKFLVVALP